MKSTVACLTLLLLVSGSAADAATGAPEYRAAGDISIGGQGGWDYLSLDPASRKLFLSHSDRVVVIDLDKNSVVQEITGTPGVHGIAIAPDLKKAYSSNGKEGQVSVIELGGFKTQAKVKVGENPDAILYEPSRQEVYVFNGRSQSVSVINAKTDQVVATVLLPGKPEAGVYDSGARRVYVNIEDKNEVIALDIESHRIVSTWPLKGCESPSGLAIDLKGKRLFSVCENEKLMLIDSKSGEVLSSAPTGQGTDGVDFDPKLELAFCSNGKSATVTIVQEDPPGRLKVRQVLKTQIGARTIAVDPVSHKIYLPTAQFHPAVPGTRPRPIDGTQKLLIYGPKLP